MRVPLSTKQYQLVLTIGGDAVKQRYSQPDYSWLTVESRIQPVDEERPSRLWLTKQTNSVNIRDVSHVTNIHLLSTGSRLWLANPGCG